MQIAYMRKEGRSSFCFTRYISFLVPCLVKLGSTAVIMDPITIIKWEQLLLHCEDCMFHYLAEKTNGVFL